MGRFRIVDDQTIREGMCTDIYFVRTEEILRREGLNPMVTMEVTTVSLPWPWGIFCGLEDVLTLLEGVPIFLDAMAEGCRFFPNEPVMRITGRYIDIARYETAILGFLCHASGIATAAAHLTVAAAGVPIYSFGSRRQHPAIASMVERAAWIGGVTGVSNICAPEGVPLVGTMPHSFIICHSSPEHAFRAFDRIAQPEVPRIMLCDTHCDEKREVLIAAAAGAEAVRIDTPSSRRGDLRAILEEVRWELDTAGFETVKIVLSGGITKEDVLKLRDLVNAFGIGGAIANGPVIDFSLDIVEINGQPYAKRGKRSGVKQVYEYRDLHHETLLVEHHPPESARPLLQPWIKYGEVLARSDLHEARERVLRAFQSDGANAPAGGE